MLILEQSSTFQAVLSAAGLRGATEIEIRDDQLFVDGVPYALRPAHQALEAAADPVPTPLAPPDSPAGEPLVPSHNPAGDSPSPPDPGSDSAVI